MIASDIATLLGCEVEGDSSRKILRLASFSSSKGGDLTFWNYGTISHMSHQGRTIIVPQAASTSSEGKNTYLRVDNPRLAFARAAQFFTSKHPEVYKESFVIDPTARIHPLVTLNGKVVVGHNVSIQEFCSIGTAGFGYERDEDGRWVAIPQIGGVIIEEDVDIAAHTNVHRGTLDNTVIGMGSKVSINCNIGHNVVIGKHTFVAGKSNFGGKTRIGDYCFIGMGTITKPGVTIGDNVTIGMGSIVTKDIPRNAVAYGNPCKVVEDKTLNKEN